jgi:hypothetical protein
MHGSNGHAAAARPAPSEKPSRADGGAAPAAAPADRGPGGKFAAGNRVGKQFGQGQVQAHGNPTYRRMAALRLKVLEVVTPERLAQLVESLLRRAMRGDAVCAKLVMQYTCGKAPPPVDVDAADIHEWGLAARAPDWVAVLGAALKTVPPGVAAAEARGRPSAAGATVRRVLDQVAGPLTE